MEYSQKTARLLFVGSQDEWLRFVRLALAQDYEVQISHELTAVLELRDKDLSFDLVFVDLGLAESSREVLSQLAKASDRKWRFVVLFPGSPDGSIARPFFKAGAQDVVSKP